MRVQQVDLLFAKDPTELEAPEILAELALVLAEDDLHAFRFHPVGQRPAGADAADRQSILRRIDVAAELHDDSLHAADVHAEGHLHDVNPAIHAHGAAPAPAWSSDQRSSSAKSAV